MTNLTCGLVPSIPATTLVRLPAPRELPVVHRFAWNASLPAQSPYLSERFLSHELIAADIADAIKPLAPALTAIWGDTPDADAQRDVDIVQLAAVLRFHMYLRGWPVVIVPPFWVRQLGRIARLVLPAYDAAASGVCPGVPLRQAQAAIVLAHTACCLLLPDGYPRAFREAVAEFKGGLRLPKAG